MYFIIFSDLEKGKGKEENSAKYCFLSVSCSGECAEVNIQLHSKSDNGILPSDTIAVP